LIGVPGNGRPVERVLAPLCLVEANDVAADAFPLAPDDLHAGAGTGAYEAGTNGERFNILAVDARLGRNRYRRRHKRVPHSAS
jgi:hypothetical protein